VIPELERVVSEYRAAFDAIATRFQDGDVTVAQGRAALDELLDVARQASDPAEFTRLAQERSLFQRIGQAMTALSARLLDRPVPEANDGWDPETAAQAAESKTAEPDDEGPPVGAHDDPEHDEGTASLPPGLSQMLKPYHDRLSMLSPQAGYSRRALRKILDAGERVDGVPAFLRALAERNLDVELTRAERKDQAMAALADARSRGDTLAEQYAAQVLRALAEAPPHDELALSATLERLRVNNDRSRTRLDYRLERVTRLFTALSAYLDVRDADRRSCARRAYRQLGARHGLTWGAIFVDPLLRVELDRRRDDWPPERLESLRRALFEEVLES
jgi:hypothetical protein